jgi:hypothetical protein
VKTSHFDIQAVLAREGVIALRHHPDLVDPIRWLVRRGDLHPMLPGVYAPRLDVDTFDTRISALMAWEPNAILVAAAAARVSFGPPSEFRPSRARPSTTGSRSAGSTSAGVRCPPS